MTDPTSTTPPPDHAASIATLVADRKAQADGFAAAARAPVERLPMDVYVWEDVDGEHVRVPQSTRDAFLADYRAKRDAVISGAAALEAEIAEFASLSPLERVRRYPNMDERAALARLTHRGSAI